MSQTVADLLSRLTPDPWRASTPFSGDIAAANKRIFEAGDASDTICGVLGEWLQKHQPCLFGRIAARQDLISYCILTERDLRQDDEAIRAKIQDARLQWLQDGFVGKKSGFVVLAASPTLALAAPDANLKALAQKLCSFFLLKEVDVDRIYHEEIFLEQPGADRRMWQWMAGVNYFCTNGDGRWWQDHRIPGGLAFSANSVGHLVKTGAIAREMFEEGNQTLGGVSETFVATKVDSLGKALQLAMQTIGKASEAVSGRATALMRLSDGGPTMPRCPVDLPSSLADKDFHHYVSYYHTDVTIPSEYFLPDVRRPSHCKARTMEFTYLFDTDINNPDYVTMGAGRRIRGPSTKAARVTPASVLIESSELLVRALGRR